jgi:hypothetical protein
LFQDEKYNHISQEDVDKVKKCLAEKEEWYNKNSMDSQKQSLYDSPSVLVSQIWSTKQVSKY